jgi:hypothetical protein
LDTPEEISYVTVDCDFQEVLEQDPGRIRARYADKGFYFVSGQGIPIQGPKTQEEAQEEEKMKQWMVEYMGWRAQHQMVLSPEKARVGRNAWSPRWEDIAIKESD